MSITAEMALHGVARLLRTTVAPTLEDGFATEATRLGILVLSIAANGIDDAAALRVRENAGMRDLFGRASALALPDRGLAGLLAEAASSTDPGLRIGELDVENGRLRALLVRLHEAVEGLPGDDARALDRAIWSLLRDAEIARAPRG